MISRVTAAGAQLARQPKRFLAALGGDDRESGTFQMPADEIAHGRIVVHDQDARRVQWRRCRDELAPGSAVLGPLALRDARQADRERRPLARRAFDRDVAAHHAAEMPADGESKAGAAIFAGGRGIGLRELLKQPAHLLRVHPDAGIGDRNRDPVALFAAQRACCDGNGAILGELVGVAGEVEQRLAKAGLVGMDGAEIGGAIDDDAVAVLLRQRLHGLDDVLDQRSERERFEVKLHSPGFDLGQVENVVDQREQMARGAQHPVERLDLILAFEVAGVLQQHLGDADDGIERSAQLMAHVGEELRLVLARDLELTALLLDFLEQAHVLDGDRSLVGEGGTSSICLSVNGRGSDRVKARTPIAVPSRSMGTPRMARKPPSLCASAKVYSGSASTSGIWMTRLSSSARPATDPRSGSTGTVLT